MVNTASRTVKVDAGVKLRDLLDLLANYDDDDKKNDNEASGVNVGFGGGGDGYTLPAFPWFIDQTVGGAVATATHGSSLRHGSLSSQVTALTMVLANGTVLSLGEENASSTHLFEAARASIGRLGVVVDVTIRIVPNRPVRKTSTVLDPLDFVDDVVAASTAVARCEVAFSAGGNRGAAWECAMASPEVRRLDETQLFWFFPLGKIVRVEFHRLDMLPEEILAGSPFALSTPPGRAHHQQRRAAPA